jgi:hypothetical protein
LELRGNTRWEKRHNQDILKALHSEVEGPLEVDELGRMDIDDEGSSRLADEDEWARR